MELLMAKIPAGGSRRRLGTVTTFQGKRVVNVDGNLIDATWADPMVVDDGDPVEVEFYGAGIGSKAHVISRSTPQPRPRTGIVVQVPAGSPTITVEAGGVQYVTEPVYDNPAKDDQVHLDWGAGQPRTFGKVTTTPLPPPPVVEQPIPPPPPPPTSGKTTATAIGSRTYWAPGGWGSYAGDGNKVHQGTYGNATVTGAWFYGDGNPFAALAGRRIDRITFRTGNRLAVGAHGAPATFHFFAHTNPFQPGGDTNRVLGPHDWTAPPGQSATTIDLPLSFADTLINGGGIAVQGEPYAAMQGHTAGSPDSGTITIYWTK